MIAGTLALGESKDRRD